MKMFMQTLSEVWEVYKFTIYILTPPLYFIPNGIRDTLYWPRLKPITGS